MKKICSFIPTFRIFPSYLLRSVSSVFSVVSTLALRRGMYAVLIACTVLTLSSPAVAEEDAAETPAILNINTADAESIAASLNGIGIVRAKAIVNYRLKHGDYLHIDELQDVPGIGEVTFERIKSKLSVTSRSLTDKQQGAATAQLAAPGN